MNCETIRLPDRGSSAPVAPKGAVDRGCWSCPLAKAGVDLQAHAFTEVPTRRLHVRMAAEALVLRVHSIDRRSLPDLQSAGTFQRR